MIALDQGVDGGEGGGDNEQGEEADRAGDQLPGAAVLARVVADDRVLVCPPDRRRDRGCAVNEARVSAMPRLGGDRSEVDPEGLGVESAGQRRRECIRTGGVEVFERVIPGERPAREGDKNPAARLL